MKHNEFIVFVLALMIIGAVLVGLYNNDNKKAMVRGFDFESSEEGTIMFWTDMNIPKERSDVDYLMFFTSARVRGLKIVYDFRDFRLKAGMPLISSGKEINFDGNRHGIAYTFKKNGKQMLYFDGEPVAKGPFVADERAPLVGLAVYEEVRVLDASYEADDVVVYNKFLSEEEIEGIFIR